MTCVVLRKNGSIIVRYKWIYLCIGKLIAFALNERQKTWIILFLVDLGWHWSFHGRVVYHGQIWWWHPEALQAFVRIDQRSLRSPKDQALGGNSTEDRTITSWIEMNFQLSKMIQKNLILILKVGQFIFKLQFLDYTF